jgi:hypothetical protein
MTFLLEKKAESKNPYVGRSVELAFMLFLYTITGTWDKPS